MPKLKRKSHRLSQPLLKFEESALAKGFRVIAGVDEAGRGCLAGPVVAAACILPLTEDFSGVNDSKQLTASQREVFFELITEKALAFGFGVVAPDEIDRMNILRASLKAMGLAIENMKQKPDLILVDGRQIIPLLTIQQQPITKGDCLSLSIAAASILAKVKRDTLMQQFAKEYPEYRFDLHKGYGTRIHWEALERFGPTPIHRLSFRGVAPGTI